VRAKAVHALRAVAGRVECVIYRRDDAAFCPADPVECPA
jgi:hypothetical protein